MQPVTETLQLLSGLKHAVTLSLATAGIAVIVYTGFRNSHPCVWVRKEHEGPPIHADSYQVAARVLDGKEVA